MRLPWLQIDADGMTRGEMLGRLLCIGPDGGIGLSLRLWRWALEMSPEGDFSGGRHEIRNIAAAVAWDPNDAEKLLSELVAVGLVEMPVGAGFARIRGLERYRRAWEKNQRRKPAPKVPVTGATGAGYRPEPARKTETENKSISADKPADARKPRKPSAQEAWAAKAQGQRLKMRPGLIPESLDVVQLNTNLKAPMASIGTVGLDLAYSAYLVDTWATGIGWPWAAFVADIPKYHARALAAGPPGRPSPPAPIQTTLAEYPENFR